MAKQEFEPPKYHNQPLEYWRFDYGAEYFSFPITAHRKLPQSDSVPNLDFPRYILENQPVFSRIQLLGKTRIQYHHPEQPLWIEYWMNNQNDHMVKAIIEYSEAKIGTIYYLADTGLIRLYKTGQDSGIDYHDVSEYEDDLTTHHLNQYPDATEKELADIEEAAFLEYMAKYGHLCTVATIDFRHRDRLVYLYENVQERDNDNPKQVASFDHATSIPFFEDTYQISLSGEHNQAEIIISRGNGRQTRVGFPLWVENRMGEKLFDTVHFAWAHFNSYTQFSVQQIWKK